MPPAVPPAAGDLASLLDQSRAGTFTLPLSCFIHTSSGRPQRQAGVLELRDSIKAHGWLGSPMTVCLVGTAPDDGLTPERADSQQYRMINGNHRLAALLLIEKDLPADSPPTTISVDVHIGMTLETERMVASSLNNTTELVVKTTLCDKLEWHKAWYDDIQAKKRSKAPLSSVTVSTRLHAMSKTMGLNTYSLPTIKGFMKAVEAMKGRAIAALHDVTHLPDRSEGHIDLKDRLFYKRVTLKSLLRPEFAELTDVQQEAYIYRLASGVFSGVMTDEVFKELDKMAVAVGRMVLSAEKNFTPVETWTSDFKWYVCKMRNYELSSKFVIHFNAADRAVAEYKATLPTGMAASEKHEDWARLQPWASLLVAMRGSEGKPNAMQGHHDRYITAKDEHIEEAKAAEGRFKTKLAAQEKAATDAAKAAADAAAAEALVESTKKAAASAEASKEKAVAASVKATRATVPDPVAPEQSAPSGSAMSSSAASAPAASSAPQTDAAITPVTPAVTTAGTVAGAKRKAVDMKTSAELVQSARPLMAKLVVLDIFGSAQRAMDAPEVDIRHPANEPFMMAFVNIASNASVMTVAEEDRLKTGLVLLADNLHDRGTIVVAISDWVYDVPRIRALFAQAQLKLEEVPFISLYLQGKSGRVSKQQKNELQQQGSFTLVAHKKIKDLNFVCNGGGPRSKMDASSRAARAARVAPPRVAELDLVGAVVSTAHPPPGTFLADSTADLLIQRFSDVGDTILVSAADRDTSLSSLVLQHGRALVGLVPEMSKLSDTSGKVDVFATSAAKSGMWAKMLAAPVLTVGPTFLPALVPASNVPGSTAKALEKYAAHENPELQVARQDAAMHGLKIEVSKIHGNGLFADQDLMVSGDFIPVPLVGAFEVHDNEAGCWQAIKRDGVPRFLVSNNIAPFLSGGEVARPTSALYLVPDKTSPLFYMNSSALDAETENFMEGIALKPSRDFRGGADVKAVLGNPSNCVSFAISADVSAGTELLAFYRFQEEQEGDEMSD